MQRPNDLYPILKESFKGTRLPVAILLKEALEQNAEYFVQESGQKKIRVATKSVRCRSLFGRFKTLLGDKYSGLMCYTAEEALWLSEKGEDDLLVAYPTWNQNQIIEVARETFKGKKIYLMVDSIEHIEHLRGCLKEQDEVKLLLCVDIDVSLKLPFLNFGVFRSPMNSVRKFKKILKAIRSEDIMELRGLMAYEAQVAGVIDNQPGKWLMNNIVRFLKKRSLKLIEKRRAACVKACYDLDIQLDFVNGGGTGSLRTTRKEAAVTEVTIGSGFYTPTLFDQYCDLKSIPSLFYGLEVVRHPAKNIYTCLGGGYVASGSLGLEKLPKPFLPLDAKLHPNEMAGEVQTPIICKSTKLQLGDPVFMRHAKAGELLEHFKEVKVISNEGEVLEIIPTYRGENQNFL